MKIENISERADAQPQYIAMNGEYISETCLGLQFHRLGIVGFSGLAKFQTRDAEKQDPRARVTTFNDDLAKSIKGNTPGTDDRNAMLFAKARAGDKKAREELISGMIPYIFKKVESFIRVMPSLSTDREDLIQFCCLKATHCTNTMLKNGVQQPTKYLQRSIINACKYFVQWHVKPARSSIPGTVRAPPRSNLDELREEILACCLTDEERKVIALREEGHDDPAITRLTGLKKTNLHRIRRRVEARFQDRRN